MMRLEQIDDLMSSDGNGMEDRERGGRQTGLAWLIVLVLVLAGAVGLAWSNPTMDDYLRFVELELHRALDQLEERASGEDGRFIRELVRAQSKQIVNGVVRSATMRSNWGLLSRYETQVVGTKVVVLGIAGRLVPLGGIEEAIKKIGQLPF